jgi:uncharacterized protein YjbJ (UPF0337 family)
MNKPAPPPSRDGRARGKAVQSETAQYLGNVGPRPPQSSTPEEDAISDRWKRLVGSARIVWAKLGEEELLNSNGQADRLTGLVQERYAISREAAGKRVQSFLQQYKLLPMIEPKRG